MGRGPSEGGVRSLEIRLLQPQEGDQGVARAAVRVTYFARRFPLKDRHSAIPTIAMGMTANGAHTSGTAQMPHDTAMIRTNTGTATHQGQGFAFIFPTVGRP